MIVIGAGPAGIGTIGSLLENGYKNITWIDPKFLNG
jgi:cation diffusion facilitator CzcD-associated flavoprotein CzcO